MTPYVGDAELACEYRHSVGAALSRFFTSLRDDCLILGRRCDRCDLVAVPAQDYCEMCAGDLAEWVSVGPEGTVTGITKMPGGLPESPLGGPLAVLRVRLDGADVDLIHLSTGFENVDVGSRVRPIWRTERQGEITDILGMELAE